MHCTSSRGQKLPEEIQGKLNACNLLPDYQDNFSTPNPQVYCFHLLNLGQKENSLLGNLILLTKGMKVLETAVGAVFAPTSTVWTTSLRHSCSVEYELEVF